MDIHCLSTHAAYRCRHSGACCSSGWAIPVEAPLYRRWSDALADRKDAVVTREDLPAGLTGVLRTRPDNTCVFFDRSSQLCDLHRLHGHDWLPTSCRQFPRVSLIDRRGVFVTLSHYCPTAAALLFDDGPIALVVNPPAFPRDAEYEGLDAREAFPPLLRPGVLMDWDALDAWDRFAFARLDRETDHVDAALQDLTAVCEALRRWTPADGPLASRVDMAAQPRDRSERHAEGEPEAIKMRVWRFEREVHAATPEPPDVDLTFDVDGFTEASARWVDPMWSAFARPLCRYAAAKLCASWCWYQGDGLRTVIRSVEAALAVVRVEAAKRARRQGRMLDRALLRESIRQADLRLVHLASREALARQWSAAEHED